MDLSRSFYESVSLPETSGWMSGLLILSMPPSSSGFGEQLELLVGCVPSWLSQPEVRLVQRGNLNPARLVTRQVGLGDVTAVLEDMTNFRTIGFNVIT